MNKVKIIIATIFIICIVFICFIFVNNNKNNLTNENQDNLTNENQDNLTNENQDNLTSENQDNLTNEEIVQIYNENKQTINNIKDGLLSSDFIPNDDESMRLYYEDGELICSEDSSGGKLRSIQIIHKDLTDYFSNTEKGLNARIRYRKLFEDIVIEFSFFSDEIDQGIVYTNNPNGSGIQEHIEDKWYVYFFGMV